MQNKGGIYLTVDEVAQRWKISRANVLRLIARGALVARNFGATGRKRASWRISEADLSAFEANAISTTAPGVSPGGATT